MTLHPWRFQIDRDGQGAARGWQHPETDDSAWSVADLGRSWADQGFDSGDSPVWFRQWIPARPSWRGATLAIQKSDAEITLYANGQARPGRTIDADDPNQRFTVFDLGDAFQPDRRTLIALRIVPRRGIGAAAGVATVGPRLEAVVSRRQVVRYYHQTNPRWLLPTWAEDRPSAWTVLGREAGQKKALLGIDGSFSPRNPGLTIATWLYDRDRPALYTPEGSPSRPRRLRDGHLPIVEETWSAGRVDVETTLFVPDPDPVSATASGQGAVPPHVRYRAALVNRSSSPFNGRLYFAIRPYDVRSSAVSIGQLEMDARLGAILVDGRPGLMFAPDGARFGGGRLADGDPSIFAAEGELPPGERADDPDGFAVGALAYDVRLEPGERRAFDLAAPIEPPEASAAWPYALLTDDVDALAAVTARRWAERLHKVAVTLPDRRLVDAFYASLAYILINQTGERFHPGPLEHNAFWTRDTAYITLALHRAGLGDRARPVLRQLVAAQRPTGEFPPIVEPDGRPRATMVLDGREQPFNEWDSQGEGIFALVEHARATNDDAFLREVYPAIQRAADFLIRLRATQASAPGAARGILPPSVSAEDIGPATWHHYWDDFWGIAGLMKAAEAAGRLGNRAGAERYEAEVVAFRRDLLASIAATRARFGLVQIPNGPEDHDRSADARGTNPAIWPVAVLPDETPLLRISFLRYFEAYIARYGGGYRHDLDLAWPYGGLGLAQGFLRLGMRDQVWTVLDWTMSHETMPGVFAWAEGMQPDTRAFGIGDMPHSWAAAELVNLVRDSVVTERDGKLVVGLGVPLRWLRDGAPIEIRDAPTDFGLAGIRLRGAVSADETSNATTGWIELENLGAARPPRGYRLALPVAAIPRTLLVDGVERPAVSSEAIDLPDDFRVARIEFGGGEPRQ